MTPVRVETGPLGLDPESSIRPLYLPVAAVGVVSGPSKPSASRRILVNEVKFHVDRNVATELG